MRPSPPTSSSERPLRHREAPSQRAGRTPDRPRPRRRLREDQRAAAEVIGYAITFGILSVVLVVALNGFNETQRDAEDRIVTLRAQSAAQRVAGTIVEVSLLAEDQDLDLYRRDIMLPDDFEGSPYTVAIGADTVYVNVTRSGVSLEEPLFGALSSSGIAVCSLSDPLSGGPLRVTFTNSGGGELCITEVS